MQMDFKNWHNLCSANNKYVDIVVFVAAHSSSELATHQLWTHVGSIYLISYDFQYFVHCKQILNINKKIGSFDDK